MRSRCTASFWRLYNALPTETRRRARAADRRWRQDPSHPGLRFKRVHPSEPIWSLRIDIDHRALGLRDGDGVVWFWIGSHADDDRLLHRR